MSTTAEDISTTLSSNEPSVEPTDAIAELLTGEVSDSEDKDDEETQTAKSKPESDEESKEDSEAAEDSEEETTLEAVADDELTWGSVLGIDDDKLSFDEEGNIVGFKVKVDGEESVVKTDEMWAGYQNNKSFTQKSQAHAEEVKQFNVQKEQVEQVYASKLESVDQLTKYFEKQLISEWDNVDWNALRENDPAEYAAARQDYATRASELKNIQDAIAADKETQATESLQEQQQRAQSYINEQHNLMLVNNPEWSDEKVREKARDGLKGFVSDTYGFKETEFDSVFDARLIELIKDARKYHEGAKVAAKKIVKPVPKFQKSRGGGSKPAASKLDKLTSAAAKASGAEKRDLQTSAVAELLTGSI